MADRQGSMTGLTEEEAIEFNKWMIRGTIIYILFAIVAHWLVWAWQPWFANDPGNYGLLETVTNTAQMLLG